MTQPAYEEIKKLGPNIYIPSLNEIERFSTQRFTGSVDNTLGKSMAIEYLGSKQYPRVPEGEDYFRDDLEAVMDAYGVPSTPNIENALLAGNETFQNSLWGKIEGKKNFTSIRDVKHPVYGTFIRFFSRLWVGLITDPDNGIPRSCMQPKTTEGKSIAELQEGWGYRLIQEMTDGAISLDPDNFIDIQLYFALREITAEADRKSREILGTTPDPFLLVA